MLKFFCELSQHFTDVMDNINPLTTLHNMIAEMVIKINNPERRNEAFDRTHDLIDMRLKNIKTSFKKLEFKITVKNLTTFKSFVESVKANAEMCNEQYFIINYPKYVLNCPHYPHFIITKLELLLDLLFAIFVSFTHKSTMSIWDVKK